MKIHAWVAIACLIVSAGAPAASAQFGWESYYLYLGNHPTQEENYWSHEAQGIAHDDDHWYITQDTHLWKIPVGNDLSDNSAGPNTLHLEIENTFLGASGYNHFGDFEFYERDGRGYLFIPVTAPDNNPPRAVAAFRADSLTYIDHAPVGAASWAATDADGLLYFGNDDGLLQYQVDWDLLRDASTLVLSNETQHFLTRANGEPIRWSHNQGGAFSPDGTRLYVTTGFPGASAASHGIHVFDVPSWRRVQKSTNGSGHFNYEFDPTSGLSDEEPEGLTIWDLDDGRAPGIRGQLHVILLDNDCGCACPPIGDCDDVYLKHYTGTIYVNRIFTGVENGTPSHPFNTVAEAVNLAWTDAQIKIFPGSYLENITIDKRVRITPWGGGTVRIGN